jgi:hypothetical protein
LVKLGLTSAAISPFAAVAQDAGFEGGTIGAVGGRAEAELFPGKALLGGGQLEVPLAASLYTSDPDQLEVAQRMKPFNLESWVVEWTRVAEKNEEEAAKLVAEEQKSPPTSTICGHPISIAKPVGPNLLLSRACSPPTRKCVRRFDKAWQLVRPPFERVQISWEGKPLDGYFRKPGGPAGERFPTVIAFQDADTMCEATILNAGGYAALGMACLAVDFPGQAGSLRLKNPHLPPDTERVAKAMIDYLETRPDVDPNRIGMQGISMGGYGVPRAASGEKSD